jgi:predicted membrane protein
MKKVNIKLGLLALAFFSAMSLTAQDHTISIGNAASTTIIIKEVNRVRVEAYSGNEIQIEASGGKEKSKKQLERANGLKALSAMGEDNTGLGLNVTKSGDEVTIFQASRRGQGKYTIKVPANVKLQIKHTGNWEGGKIEIQGMTGEIEISGNHNGVYMEDITGPALVSTVYGDIKVVFASVNQSSPISLESTYGDVDVTLPEDTKADLTIKTPYGEAFSDLDMEFPKKEGMKRMSTTIEGQINGGGVEMYLKASYQNIYLRKK